MGQVWGGGREVVQLEGGPNQRLNQSKVWRFDKWSEWSCDPSGVECRASETSLDKVVCRAVHPGASGRGRD